MPLTHLTNGGAGYVEGVKRLGIPPLVISDAAYGIRDSGVNGRYATAMPSNLGAASAWDPESACAYGEVIGSELRAQGFDMTLGGGVNLTREPRNGRTFEYAGEPPGNRQALRSRKGTQDCPRARTNPSNGWWGGSESDSRRVNHKRSRWRSIRKSCRPSTTRRPAGTSRQAITKSWLVHLRTIRLSQEVSRFIEILTNKRVFQC